MTWRVEFLDDRVMAALAAFPRDIRAKFERIVGMIEANGVDRMWEPYVKHLEGPVWEMRMKRHSPGGIRHGVRPEGGRGACFCQEDPEDATA